MTALKDYRKKPLVVRAFQTTGTRVDLEVLDGEDISYRGSDRGDGSDWTTLEIYNPGSQSWRQVNKGDFIIFAPTGCRYPVLADQFERNYDALAEPV